MGDGGWSDPATAARMRDLLGKGATKTSNDVNPREKKARVVNVDVDSMTAQVWLPTDQSPITVKMLTGLIPPRWDMQSSIASSAAVGFGSTVMLKRYANKLYIAAILGDGLNSAPLFSRIVKFKKSDVPMNVDPTLSDDLELFFTLPPSSATEIIFHLYYACGPLGALKTGWTVPADSTGQRSAVGLAAGVTADATSGGGDARTSAHNYTDAIVYGNRNSSVNQLYAQERSILRTVTGGRVALQIAQAASSGATTTLFKGSYVEYSPVG